MSEQKRDDGGPAFPTDELKYGGSFNEAAAKRHGGMSLRDYFIAHAPVEPQFWFKPIMPAERPKDLFCVEGSEQEHEKFKDALLEAKKIHAVSHEEVARRFIHDKNSPAKQEWDAAYEKQRLIQWPSAWADAQLQARLK